MQFKYFCLGLICWVVCLSTNQLLSIWAAKLEPNAICKSNSLDKVAMTHITNTANKNVCDWTVIYCHMTDCVLQFSILAFIQYCTVTKFTVKTKTKITDSG